MAGMVVCVEDLASGSILRCVALEGRGPGLGISPTGEVVWKEPGPIAFLLCVASDGRLVLLRPQGAPGSSVHRAGRSVDAGEEAPVFLVSGDEVEVGGRRLRIHQHGTTKRVFSPTLLSRATIAAMVLAAASPGCKLIEVRDQPPVAYDSDSGSYDVPDTCIEVSPDQVQLPDEEGSPWEVEITLSNPCEDDLEIYDIALSPDTAPLVLSSLGTVLIPQGQSTTFTVSVTDSSAAFEARVLIDSNDYDTPTATVDVQVDVD